MVSSSISVLISSCILGTLARPQAFQNFVVARTYLEGSCTANKASLAYYSFDTDSTLTATYWIWRQESPSARVSTGSTPDASCTGAEAYARACPMLVPDGYLSGGTAASGHYNFDAAGQLVINWGGGADETWALTRGFDDTSGTYASFRLAAGAHFNHGIMLGSNAPFESNAPLSAIAPYQDQPFAWIRGQGTDQEGVSFVWHVIPSGWSADTAAPAGYQTCASSPFLTARHDATGLGYCECKKKDGSADPNHWVSTYVQEFGGRQNAWNHWCECLTGGDLCYVGNSHVKPMLQAVDSNGAWLGWVGVEASFYPGGKNPGGDMLGLFAIGEALVSVGPAATSLKTNRTVVV